MKGIKAILFTALLLTASLAGCLEGEAGADGADGANGIDGKDGEMGMQGPAGPQGPAGEGSSLHIVNTTDELPHCDNREFGQLYFVSSLAAFKLCSEPGWSQIDLVGPAGEDGADGQDGSQGINGSDGQDGVNGTSVLVTTTPIVSTKICANHGVRIDVGLDLDGNGSLDTEEIESTVNVCNGDDGSDGQDGADGQDGSASINTMLTSVSTPSADLGCIINGRVIQQGLDNGDGQGIAQNGILETGEIDYSTTYCSSITTTRQHIAGDNAHSDFGDQLSLEYAGVIYFNANLDSTGEELWAFAHSNGTIWQVADICPGTCSSTPGLWGVSTVMNGILYFTADTAAGGTDLWAHSPQNKTTWNIDVSPGASDGFYYDCNEFIVVDGILYFNGQLSTGPELLAYSPANETTWMVANINPVGYSCPGKRMFEQIGDVIYFDANDGSNGVELWAHNTTNGNTWIAADIARGSSSSYPGEGFSLTDGDILYFSATTSNEGNEIWAYNTSNTSKWLISDINPGAPSSFPGTYFAHIVNGVLYVNANDGNQGDEIWAYSTQTHATWRVSNIRSGTGATHIGYGLDVQIGDVIYFSATDGNSLRPFYALDTTNNSVWKVYDFSSGSIFTSNTVGYKGYIVDEHMIYTTATSFATGTELWSYNTITDEVHLTMDFRPGTSDGFYYQGMFNSVDDKVIVAGSFDYGEYGFVIIEQNHEIFYE